MVLDFYDKLKTLSRGYASLDYHVTGYWESPLVKMDILVNGDPVDALSVIVHRDAAYERGRALASKMRELIPRQMFEVAIQAALTGHPVFSTLNTNDAPSAITRLVDMGLKPFLVASSIQAILAQRLGRVLCVKCKEPDRGPDENWLRMAGPIFDNSMALELLTFMEPDVREGARAIREKRPPKFPSAPATA